MLCKFHEVSHVTFALLQILVLIVRLNDGARVQFVWSHVVYDVVDGHSDYPLFVCGCVR